MKKKIILTFGLLFLVKSSAFSQTLQDTKDFIIEKVTSNNPLSNHINYIFFQNILESGANKLAGKKLSKDEFDNIFIYSYEVYSGKHNENWMWSIAQVIDIRDVKKVSTTKTTGKYNFYTINVYIGNNFYSKNYNNNLMSDSPEYKYLDKMEIIVSDNKETVEKIKKAIIHLAKLKGANVIDGDLF